LLTDPEIQSFIGNGATRQWYSITVSSNDGSCKSSYDVNKNDDDDDDGCILQHFRHIATFKAYVTMGSASVSIS